jgi:hypothetical protein
MLHPYPTNARGGLGDWPDQTTPTIRWLQNLRAARTHSTLRALAEYVEVGPAIGHRLSQCVPTSQLERVSGSAGAELLLAR